MEITDSAADLDNAAAHWVARLHSGSVSFAERKAFDGWVAQSDRHYGAYTRACAIWVSLSPIDKGDGRPDHEREADIVSLERRPVMARRAAIAAGLSALLMASWGLYQQGSSEKRFVTGVGEQRRLPLGSIGTVLLNTKTAVAMNCSEAGSCENIEVLDGEALFSIRSAAASLTVECRDLTLSCIDAVFSLAVDGFDSRVTVIRGVVHLAGDGMKDHALSAGSQAIIGQGAATVRKIGQEAADRAVAWTTGYLVFSGETLAETVAAMNRYNQLQISLGSGVPAQDPVVGRFSINDPEASATAVAQIYTFSVFIQDSRITLTGSPAI